MSKQALQYSTYSFYLDLFLLHCADSWIPPLVQLCFINWSLNHYFHGFNGESGTENAGTHDLSGNLGLAVIRTCKGLHAGICRSYCLATELEGVLYAQEVESMGAVSRNTESHWK